LREKGCSPGEIKNPIILITLPDLREELLNREKWSF
jgi:hypothetical protein